MRPAAISLCAVALSAAGSEARAGHAISLVGGPGGCPSHLEFATALRAIFPDVSIATDGRAADLRVELDGDGSRYRVVAGTLAREFTDAAMRCDERARHAAVFVALVLEPPSVGAAVAAPVERSPRPPPIELAVGSLTDTGTTGSNRVVATGAEAELFVGGDHVGAVLGIGALSPSTLSLQGVRARLTRIPVELGVRGRVRSGELAWSADAGVAAAIQITTGLDTADSVTQTRLELGARLAARLEYWHWARVAPFAAIAAEWIPDAYNLTWPARGVVGTTPSSWLGALVGVTFALR